jgi:hypothetical protein
MSRFVNADARGRYVARCRAARSFGWLLVVGLAGCSRLPAYARPQGALMDPSSTADEDLIEYRTLTKADFQGPKPNGEAAEHVDAMGAQTYAIVRPDPNIKLLVTGRERANGVMHYSGKLTAPLHFRAQMDRKKSWWNPTLRDVPESYVLQHEQIHFAIAALEAQGLNDRAAALTSSIHAEGDSEGEVKSAIQEKLDAIIRGALDRLIERNGKFDEDTSARYVPKKQDEWWRRVSSELRAEKR